MTTSKTVPADRIPLQDMHGIIETAMDGLDLEHDSSWVRPPECPCHAGAQSCLLPSSAGSCQGHAAEVPTPPEHVITAGILCSALPACDEAGTMDTREAALSILSVITERLAYPYTLRAAKLRDRLVAASEEYESAHGAVVHSAAEVPGYSARCQHCGGPIAIARGPRARFCKNGCRVMASRARKRERERVNETASPDR